MTELTVGLAGLGAIGTMIAEAFAAGIDGMRLIAIAERNVDHAKAVASGFATPPELTDIEGLLSADLVIEALPPFVFDQVAGPAIEAGRTFLPCSVGALLTRPELILRAAQTGARILVPTGAIAGLDAIRAMSAEDVQSIRLKTRKPPAGLLGVPYVDEQGIDLTKIEAPVCVFRGTALDACRHFPANANVAAALSLAGIGAEKTQVEIWAEPDLKRNIHEIHALSPSVNLSIVVENIASPANPKTSRLAPLSILACLRSQVGTIRVGS